MGGGECIFTIAHDVRDLLQGVARELDVGDLHDGREELRLRCQR